MAFCRNCGAEMEENQQYCVRCGAQVGGENGAQTVSNKKSELNIGMLVWSIINTVLCCNILGIIALVFTILANGKSEEEAAQNIKVAKILNIVGTIGAVLIVVLYVFLIMIGMAASL